MIYLLDTNVVSELRKVRAGRANANVVAWAERQQPYSQFISVVTLLELELGILLIERRDASQGKLLRAWMMDRVMPAFEGRILPIDREVAQRSAALHVPDPRPERDAFIAATALVRGMTIVTRNVPDFAQMGVKLIDPWQVSKTL